MVARVVLRVAWPMFVPMALLASGALVCLHESTCFDVPVRVSFVKGAVCLIFNSGLLHIPLR